MSIVFFLLIGIFVASAILFLRYKIFKKNEKLKNMYLNGYWIEEEENEDTNGGDTVKTNKANLTKLKLINTEELTKGQLLGKGAFGSVYEAVWYPVDEKRFHVKVAIKELRTETTEEKSEELIDEAKIMATVSHPCCLRLIGICMAKPLTLVTPLVQYGSILNLYEKHKTRISEKMMLVWCAQIADGMDYLEGRDIVHRDLAARNVLVQDFNQIKITDFGLAKILTSAIESTNEANSLWPIKWLAPESIEKRVFTHKSDVWSYGIVCWEIFTFGAKPYENVPLKDVFFHVKVSGSRLPQPLCSSIDVYMQLLKCWMEDPMSRPSFAKLKADFTLMSKDPKRYLAITVSPCKRLTCLLCLLNIPFKTECLAGPSLTRPDSCQVTRLKSDSYIDDEIDDIEVPETFVHSTERNLSPSIPASSADYGFFSGRSEDDTYLNEVSRILFGFGSVERRRQLFAFQSLLACPSRAAIRIRCTNSSPMGVN